MRVHFLSLVLVFAVAASGFGQPVHLSGVVRGYSDTDTTLLGLTTVVIENLATSHRDSVIADTVGHWSWTGSSGVAGEHGASVPSDLALAPSYPNPFSETTTIRMQNNVPQRVRLDVYNILGQRVAELVDDNLRPGAFELKWNGVNRNGKALAQGMYFLCLKGGGHAVTQKMVVLGNGSGAADLSLRMSSQGSAEWFTPSQNADLKGSRSTLDEFNLRLEFRHAGYDSLIMNLTLPDGGDSSVVNYLHHHTPPTAGMVFIPAGPLSMGAEYQSPYSLPIHTVSVPAFYMDIYEVTNAQYRAFCDATSRTYPPDPSNFYTPPYFTNPVYANYPVVSLSWNDAHAYAIWAGKRLPTEAEWERAAKGNADNRQYPWGDTWVAANANIYDNPADGYIYTSPVGSYPNGISPAGCYDMAGNVWEWCEDDWHDSYDGAPINGSAWIDTPRGSYRAQRGSSWSGEGTSARCANRGREDPTSSGGRSDGFRCAMSVVTDSMVLIPAGPFSMGATFEDQAQPIHTVDVPAFYMDIYEVTNAQYRAFCTATSRAVPPDPGFSGMPNYFTSAIYANYPAVNVDWNDARAYASWAGKRLPTEAEWERAAKGNSDNRLYPWGNTWVVANANIGNGNADGYDFTSPVGNYPNGISPTGCYDMVGNVWEWCEDDWHSSYTGAPTNGSAWNDNPRGTTRVLRGGCWGAEIDNNVRCAHHGYYGPTERNAAIGFRCARTP